MILSADIRAALEDFNTAFLNCSVADPCLVLPGTVLPPPAVCFASIAGGFIPQANGGDLIRLNMASGAATLVGSTGIVGDSGFSAVTALAINSAGEIFSTNVACDAVLYKIDPTTGAGTSVALTTGGADCGFGCNNGGLLYPDALAFDASDVLYAVDSCNDLYTVDIATGVGTKIGPVGVAIRGIDFDPTTGVLWGGHGAGANRDNIYTIDTTTGAATLVGPTGVIIGGTTRPTPSLCFDEDGNLFATKGGGGFDNLLISIDKSNGAGTVIAPITLGGVPLRAVGGMALRSGASAQRAAGSLQSAEPAGASPETRAGATVPVRTALFANDPNPFNPTTWIRFDLHDAQGVDLRIYDTGGRLVRQLVQETRAAGEHAVAWDGRDTAGRPVASGVYFYRLEAGDFTGTRRMLLLK